MVDLSTSYTTNISKAYTNTQITKSTTLIAKPIQFNGLDIIALFLHCFYTS